MLAAIALSLLDQCPSREASVDFQPDVDGAGL